MSTIKDVAKEASISIGTVSRYVNGKKLKEVNRIAIEAAIEKLGYTTNSIAKSMKTGKSMTIAVIVPNLSNMFSMRIIESIENTLDKNNYNVLVAGCNGEENKQYAKLESLKNKMVDGIVLLPIGKDSNKIKRFIGDIPLVLIDRVLDRPIYDSVTINNSEASYHRVKEILHTGVRNVGIIKGPQCLSTARQRYEGYRKALKEFNIEQMNAVQGGYTYESGYQAMQKLIQHPLQMVFTTNYELTIGAIRAINEHHIKIKLLGFDNLELSTVVNQPFEFISQPIEEIGEKAAQLLLDRIHTPTRKIVNLVIKI
jgi:LacI family transcriptional regulator